MEFQVAIRFRFPRIVSRIVHTRPRAIRAADRVRAPFAPRGASDPSACYSLARMLKSSGIVSQPETITSAGEPSMPLPRIREQRPLPGTFHPLSRREICLALGFFGAECVYGIRAITLASAVTPTTGDLSFGRLIVPGQIILSAQSIPPMDHRGPVADRRRSAVALRRGDHRTHRGRHADDHRVAGRDAARFHALRCAHARNRAPRLPAPYRQTVGAYRPHEGS